MAKTTKNVIPAVEEVIEEPVKAPKVIKKKTKTGKVYNCGLLNVRTKATVNSTILRTIPFGTTVEIIDEENEFYKIADGFVMKSYIEI